MKTRRFYGAVLFRAALALALTATAALSSRAQTIYGLSGGSLVRFEANAPGAVTVVGDLAADIVSLDFRPADGMLYGYAANLGVGPDALYRIDTATAALSLVTRPAPRMNTGLLGIDFDTGAGADRLRIMSDLGENHRIDLSDPSAPATFVDAAPAYAAGDPFGIAGRSPLLLDIAYAPDGGALYGIDYLRDTLVRFDDPSNPGTVRSVGRLGVNTDRFTSLDIALVGDLPVGFASLGPSFNPGVANALYRVDLATGAATQVGTFGVPGVNGLAVAPRASAAVPEPASLPLALLGVGVLGLMGCLRRLPSAPRHR